MGRYVLVAVALVLLGAPAFVGDASEFALTQALSGALGAARQADARIDQLQKQLTDTDARLKWVLDNWVSKQPVGEGKR